MGRLPGRTLDAAAHAQNEPVEVLKLNSFTRDIQEGHHEAVQQRTSMTKHASTAAIALWSPVQRGRCSAQMVRDRYLGLFDRIRACVCVHRMAGYRGDGYIKVYGHCPAMLRVSLCRRACAPYTYHRQKKQRSDTRYEAQSSQ